ncbi:probable tetraacyldisaccharide 4'-kinase, mitochondrial [Tanacetum coccineum]
MVDALSPWGDRHLIPFGPLGEPLTAFCRADATVISYADMEYPSPVRVTNSDWFKLLICLVFLRSSLKHNLTSSCTGLPSCALVKKYMTSEFAEALTPL